MECMRAQFDQDVIIAGRFKSVSPLNHGSFGMVFLAEDLNTRRPVAIKCLTKKPATDDVFVCPDGMSIDEHSEELSVHSAIGYHPNIVNLIESFDTDNHIYLVLDFCPNGDLYEAIRANKGPLETEHVRDFMLQLVSAVEFAHSKGIFHRDIKPENIFLTSTGSIKLGDFGLATKEIWSMEYGVGSDRYMAPEQYDGGAGSGYSPAAADVWAIGICLLNVLFSRNPFAFPSDSDPLFSDYVRDRQSLFDVFPNMSQDTFNVLMQCLALDPCKRSLSGVRDALQTVVSFTTDDESLDDFCAGNDVVQATLNREPLRTPSIASPQVDNTGSFPWAKALQDTPQKHVRQLSVIHDTDEMFPEPTKRWNYEDVEAASLASALDSGIGMSYKSSNLSSIAIPMPMSTSLPVATSRAIESIYGKDGENFSKSWSDLYEEEEEEMQRSSFESAREIERVSTAKPTEPIITRSSTPALDIKPSSRRSSTPRVSLAELRNANSRSNSPESLRHRVASSIRNIAASAPQSNSPLKRTGSAIMDKWAALGNLRRANNDAPSTPKRSVRSPERSTFSSQPNANKSSKSRDRAGSWRKSVSPHLFSNEAWNVSKDWRSPHQQHYTTSPVLCRSRNSAFTNTAKASNIPRHGDAANVDDIGDLEWVGGWHDFHL